MKILPNGIFFKSRIKKNEENRRLKKLTGACNIIATMNRGKLGLDLVDAKPFLSPLLTISLF